jgi:hypothetical protein
MGGRQMRTHGGVAAAVEAASMTGDALILVEQL